MITLKRLKNILRYGVGQSAKRTKQAIKAQQRRAIFLDASLWQPEDDLMRRRYESYRAYIEHQSAKLDDILVRLTETQQADLAEFQRRFRLCQALPEARSVLCLGARLGTEVKALHSLGYFAVGIDLNPGEHNLYVLPGDFHGIVFPDGSVDAVYTNALDHAFELKRVIAEVERLLRLNGLFIVDIITGFEEGFTPGKFESLHWPTVATLINKIVETGAFTVEEQRDLGFIRRDQWHQVVFRKKAVPQVTTATTLSDACLPDDRTPVE